MSKKVVSFCLWGDDPKYTIGAVKNLVTINIYYPDFETWVYLDPTSVPKHIIDELHAGGAKVIEREQGGWHSMFWRFEPAGDPDVDVVMVRDTDCRVIQREIGAVNEWLESDKDFHIMRDHPSHDTNIMGGLWGARGDVVRNINDLISDWDVVSAYQNDQTFLKRMVWPQIEHNAMIHDSCWRRTLQFPTPRDGLGFVGEVYNPADHPAIMWHRLLLERYINKHGELER